MAKYKVLERSFINGHLLEAGAEVVLEIDSPGSNLELLPDESGDSHDEKAGLVAELKALGIAADKRESLEKLRAKLADAKGE